MKRITTIFLCVLLSACSSTDSSAVKKQQNADTVEQNANTVEIESMNEAEHVELKKGFSYAFRYLSKDSEQIMWVKYVDNQIEFELESKSNNIVSTLTGVATSRPNQGDGESLGNEDGELIFVEEFEFTDSLGCHLIIRVDTEDFSLAQLNRVNNCKDDAYSKFHIGQIMKRV